MAIVLGRQFFGGREVLDIDASGVGMARKRNTVLVF